MGPVSKILLRGELALVPCAAHGAGGRVGSIPDGPWFYLTFLDL